MSKKVVYICDFMSSVQKRNEIAFEERIINQIKTCSPIDIFDTNNNIISGVEVYIFNSNELIQQLSDYDFPDCILFNVDMMGIDLIIDDLKDILIASPYNYIPLWGFYGNSSIDTIKLFNRELNKIVLSIRGKNLII